MNGLHRVLSRKDRPHEDLQANLPLMIDYEVFERTGICSNCSSRRDFARKLCRILRTGMSWCIISHGKTIICFILCSPFFFEILRTFRPSTLLLHGFISLVCPPSGSYLASILAFLRVPRISQRVLFSRGLFPINKWDSLLSLSRFLHPDLLTSLIVQFRNVIVNLRDLVKYPKVYLENRSVYQKIRSVHPNDILKRVQSKNVITGKSLYRRIHSAATGKFNCYMHVYLPIWETLWHLM
jgi:hypothetical protein